jgi:hypothetical protein
MPVFHTILDDICIGDMNPDCLNWLLKHSGDLKLTDEFWQKLFNSTDNPR